MFNEPFHAVGRIFANADDFLRPLHSIAGNSHPKLVSPNSWPALLFVAMGSVTSLANNPSADPTPTGVRNAHRCPYLGADRTSHAWRVKGIRIRVVHFFAGLLRKIEDISSILLMSTQNGPTRRETSRFSCSSMSTLMVDSAQLSTIWTNLSDVPNGRHPSNGVSLFTTSRLGSGDISETNF
jgi:hypothetical protein